MPYLIQGALGSSIVFIDFREFFLVMKALLGVLFLSVIIITAKAQRTCGTAEYVQTIYTS